jgi:hypothetical protein
VHESSEGHAGARFIHAKRSGIDTFSRIEQIESQHRKGNYSSLSLLEMDSLLHRARVFYEIVEDAQSTSHTFMLYLKKYLGNMVRVQSEGSVLGQRALDEQKVRSANMACLSQCEFIALGVTDYMSLVKVTAKEKRNQKFRMIFNVFKGSDALNYEHFWQLQYQFNQGASKEGTYLAEDTKKSNKIFLIEAGTCEIIKVKTRYTLSHYDFAVDDLEEFAKRNEELMELLAKLRLELEKMPDGSVYHMGFIGEGQIANLEALFSTTGSSFFTYKVKYAEIKHFDINPHIQKMAIFKGEIQRNTLEMFKLILKYRIKMLSNKNTIKDQDTIQAVKETELAKFAQSIHLTQRIKEDHLQPAYDLIFDRSSSRAASPNPEKTAKLSKGSFDDHTKPATKAEIEILKSSRMTWKKKAQQAVAREANISSEFNPGSFDAYLGLTSIMKRKAKPSLFTNLFSGRPKSKVSSKSNLIKLVQRDCSYDIATRRNSQVLVTGPQPTTEATACTDRRPANTPMACLPMKTKADSDKPGGGELSRKMSPPTAKEWPLLGEPSRDTFLVFSNNSGGMLPFKRSQHKTSKPSNSSHRIGRPLSSIWRRNSEAGLLRQSQTIKPVALDKQPVAFVVQKKGYSQLVASQLSKSNQAGQSVK